MADVARRRAVTARGWTPSWWARNAEVALAYTILGLMLAGYAILERSFFTLYTFTTHINQITALSIAGLAQTLVILSGGIDLSIGALISLSNAVAATHMGNAPGSVIWGATLAIGAGLAGGLLNGLVIVKGRLAPIIATLATSSIMTGAALFVLPDPGGYAPDYLVTAFTGRLFGLPISGLLIAGLVLLVWYPLRNSRFGQALYATGGNESAAFVSGIATARTKLIAYTLAGGLAGLTGLYVTAQTASGDPLGALPFTLKTIAAVVLGGTSLKGGKGGYVGTIAGGATISLIVGILYFAHISNFYQKVVEGVILILAIAVGSLRTIRRRGRE